MTLLGHPVESVWKEAIEGAGEHGRYNQLLPAEAEMTAANVGLYGAQLRRLEVQRC